MINTKRAIFFLALGAAAVAATRVLIKKESPAKAVKNTVTEPVKTIENVTKAAVGAAETVVKKTRRFVKGSPEAIAHMAKLREVAKKKGTKNGEGVKARRKAAKKAKRKGHETKEGLAQDQKLESSESWEESYRKKKK